MQVGKDTIPTWMMTNLYTQIVSQKFFDELRTKQQLGYIVANQPGKMIGQKVDLMYLVQSENLEPWECTERMKTFIVDMNKNFFGKALETGNSVHVEVKADGETSTEASTEESNAKDVFTKEKFLEYREALIQQLEEKPKKLGD